MMGENLASPRLRSVVIDVVRHGTEWVVTWNDARTELRSLSRDRVQHLADELWWMICEREFTVSRACGSDPVASYDTTSEIV
jgi:hypothetical protein